MKICFRLDWFRMNCVLESRICTYRFYFVRVSYEKMKCGMCKHCIPLCYVNINWTSITSCLFCIVCSLDHHLFRHKIKEYILENYTRIHIYNKCFWRGDYPIAELIDRKPPTNVGFSAMQSLEL